MQREDEQARLMYIKAVEDRLWQLDQLVKSYMPGVQQWHVQQGKNKEETIKKVWGVPKGGSKDYREASKKYNAILASLESEEA